MPEQSHPPYVSGATTIPRQLERWLDVNPQNGPLRRTETYMTVPAFDIEHVWRGYSEVVGEYHISSPNNFSLKIPHDGNVIASDTNYTMCISYVNPDHTVVRYSLIRGAGDLFYFHLEPYNGQFISKNFRIEIWNTSQVTCSEDSAPVIYTSVLGNQDYRYGTDNALASSNMLCTGQQSIGTVTLSPIGTNQELWLDGGVGWSEHLWIDRTAANPFTSSGDSSSQSDSNLITLDGSSYTGDVSNTKSLWMYIIPRFAVNFVLIHIDNLSGVTADIGLNILNQLYVTISAGGGTTTGTYKLIQNKAYILYFDQNALCNVYDAVTLQLLDSFGHSAINLDLGDFPLRIGSPFSTYDLRAAIAYNDITLNPFYTDSVFPYMQALISNAVAMSMPLTWDVCGTNPSPTDEGAVIAIG